MEILALIPARGGSVGIPQKNITNLAGKPLIYHSIKAAINCNLVDRVIVSTDNRDISNIAKKSGANVPFLRPKKLAKNDTSIIDVIYHCLDFLKTQEDYVPDMIVLLQPTSPIRDVSLIRKSINKLKNSKSTSVISVSQIKTHPDTSFSFESKYLKPLNRNFESSSNRQKRKKLYHPTGSIYTFWSSNLSKFKSIYGPRINPIETKQEYNVDIDYLFELFVAEMTFKNWNKYKKTH
jgi:CMP-N,N'-diacetyllegionaminic acid synthase